ncbi:hypothetical protein OH76DRAFT_1560481 [Lentinus brumalis]|uniref:F-box domain-containing protein n=1 Tax=Lentinus brumalis TaxID=2498619 RepID=A0A371CS27_9APHY|nr:hypothetical protein OH76DRAFT_1560481 [Polyporus brumalis]
MDFARKATASMHKLPATPATGSGKPNINSLPAELLIKILSRVSSDTPWKIVDLGLVCRAWYAVTEHSSAFWANVVSNEWRFPSLYVISAAAPRTRFLDIYSSALKQSLPYYIAVSLDISPFLELSALGASKSTLLWTLAPHSQRLVSLSLVIPSEGDLQQFYDFLSLDLSSLVELSLATPPLTLSYITDAVVVPLPVAEDVEYKPLPSSALPRILTVRVTGSLFGPWLARPSLEHLHIVGTGAESRITDRVRTCGLLIGGLQGCPRLETLEVDNTLPLWTMEYEIPVVKAWPDAHALQMLHTCTVRDDPEWVVKFTACLHRAPLPTSAMLDVTLSAPQGFIPTAGGGVSCDSSLSNDPHIQFFTEEMCALAFQRPADGHSDTAPIRMELNTVLRVYAGDKQRLELKVSPELLTLFKTRFGMSFPEALVFQIFMEPRLARTFQYPMPLRPDIAELVLDLGDRMPDTRWWREFFRFFKHVRRMEVRARDALALFQFLSGKPEDMTGLCPAERLRLQIAQCGIPSKEFMEEFTLVGMDFRMPDSDEGEIAQMVVDTFVKRKADGRQVPRDVTLRYRGARRPAFEERVVSGLEGVVRCVVVASS